MQRLSWLVVVLCIAAAVASAQKQPDNVIPRVSIGGSGYLGYSTVLPDLNIYNFRAGIGVDTVVNIMPSLGLGVEAGVAFGLANPLTGYSYVEVPIRGTATVRLGGIVLEPFGGLFLDGRNTGSGGSTAFTKAFEAGARVALGGNGFLFAEGSYVFGPAGFLRFGIGVRIGLLDFGEAAR